MGRRAYMGAKLFQIPGENNNEVFVISSDGFGSMPMKDFYGKPMDDILRMAVDHKLEFIEPEEMLEGYIKE